MRERHRNGAEEEISRYDPRFRCRMCGKSIYGVLDMKSFSGIEDLPSLSSVLYCSRECQQADSTVSIGCIAAGSFIPSWWILAALIRSEVPSSALVGAIGLLIFMSILNFLLVNETMERIKLQKKLIRERPSNLRR